MNFELFRPDLEAALAYSDGARGGRPLYDPVLMFKIVVIQAQHGLSHHRAEFLIGDRLSFVRLLGLGLGDRVPDAKTIWKFRARLTRARKWAVKAREDGAEELAGSAGAGRPEGRRCTVDDPDRPQAAHRRALGAGGDRDPHLRLQGAYEH